MPEPAKTVAPAKKTAALKLVPSGDIFDRMERMYGSIARRAYDLFETNGRRFGQDLEHWFKAESEYLHPVHIEVSEGDAGVSVSAEVPGFTNKDLDISLEGRRLTITGKRESKEERKDKKTVYTEQCSNQILRVVDLPVDVDVTKAAATLKDGVLRLEIPKAAPAKKIAIESKTA